MKPLNEPFTAEDIYVNVGKDMHRVKSMAVKDWKDLDDRIQAEYPEYDSLEFSTFVKAAGGIVPSTVEDWMIEWKHGVRILFRAEDYE